MNHTGLSFRPLLSLLAPTWFHTEEAAFHLLCDSQSYVPIKKNKSCSVRLLLESLDDKGLDDSHIDSSDGFGSSTQTLCGSGFLGLEPTITNLEVKVETDVKLCSQIRSVITSSFF